MKRGASPFRTALINCKERDQAGGTLLRAPDDDSIYVAKSSLPKNLKKKGADSTGLAYLRSRTRANGMLLRAHQRLTMARAARDRQKRRARATSLLRLTMVDRRPLRAPGPLPCPCLKTICVKSKGKK